MKKISILLITAFTLFNFVACNDNKDPEVEPEPTPTDTIFIGKVIVENPAYEKDSIEVQISKTATDSIQIFMKKVRFTSNPKAPDLDITIPNVEIVEESSNKLIIKGNNIVPIALGIPYEAYTVTDLTGTATDSSFVLTLNFGTYATSYSGKRK